LISRAKPLSSLQTLWKTIRHPYAWTLSFHVPVLSPFPRDLVIFHLILWKYSLVLTYVSSSLGRRAYALLLSFTASLCPTLLNFSLGSRPQITSFTPMLICHLF
jgi:hypothetical protein